MTPATDEQLYQLRRQAVNTVTCEIMSAGLLLTHQQADDLGIEIMKWMETRLHLTITETDRGTVCTPRRRDEAEPVIVAINAYLSPYEGGDWPGADEQYVRFVVERLQAAYPDAVLDVSTAQGRTRVWAYERTPHGNQVNDDVTEDLRGDLAANWWEEFCAQSRPDEIHCECGAWLGEQCQWTGPARETVLVEFMPEALRASHVAGGGGGRYPNNGALRIRVSRVCAEVMTTHDEEWCEIIS